MRRIVVGVIAGLALLAVVVALVLAATSSSGTTYKIQFDNAFGLVIGAPFKVAGVPAGTIESIGLDQRTRLAVVTINVTPARLRPVSLRRVLPVAPAVADRRVLHRLRARSVRQGAGAGQHDPGHAHAVHDPRGSAAEHHAPALPRAADADHQRAGRRGRGPLGDLEAALRRAVPALTETDNLLSLLANDSKTLQQLTVSADTVISALANNSLQVQRFITEANNTATVVAGQQGNLKSTLQQLPGFLEQLRPTMAQLGAAATVYEPVLANLNASASQLDRLLVDLPAFSRSAIPAIKTLGQASAVGTPAVKAAEPTVSLLNQFAGPTPELSQNLAIVLHDLDDRSRAVERDSRSPGGKGYTGLEALLQYVFNQTLAINTFGPFGHLLAVDSFVSPMCSPYATPATIALSLKQYGPSYRQCYAWLGPSQPGVNETDPSNPKGCVPDPGGAPPGERGPKTTACKLTVPDVDARARANRDERYPASRAVVATAQTAPPVASASGSGPPANGDQRAQRLLNYLLDP